MEILTSIKEFFVPCAFAGNGHYNGWHMMPFGGGMWMLILFFVIVGLFLWWFKKGGENNTDSPLDILKRRYASGEINKEEFDKIKKDLKI